MTSSEIKAALDELIELAENGKALEAFDKFYHVDLVAQENDTEPRIGKATSRIYEENFLSKITHLREYKAVDIIVGSNVSAISWKVDFDHEEWGVVNMTEINVQVWEDGQIIKETYYYN